MANALARPILYHKFIMRYLDYSTFTMAAGHCLGLFRSKIFNSCALSDTLHQHAKPSRDLSCCCRDITNFSRFFQVQCEKSLDDRA